MTIEGTHRCSRRTASSSSVRSRFLPPKKLAASPRRGRNGSRSTKLSSAEDWIGAAPTREGTRAMRAVVERMMVNWTIVGEEMHRRRGCLDDMESWKIRNVFD